MQTLYFLRTERTSKIPDYIQVRDSDFVLIAYFTVKNTKKGLEQLINYNFPEDFDKKIQEIPQGKLSKFQF